MLAYLARRGDLVRLFAARLNSRARAEDLVQAMYEKIAVAREGEAVAHPLAYLYRLGANLMLDDLRQDRRRRVRDGAWSDLQGERAATGAGGERASDAPDPHRTAEARERLARLLQAVETLPPQTQRVFRMHKLEALSHAEVAARLGVSRSAVEKHVSLALKLLTERLA